MRVTDVSSVFVSGTSSVTRRRVRRHDGCHDDMRNDKVAVKRHDDWHGTHAEHTAPATSPQCADNVHYVKLDRSDRTQAFSADVLRSPGGQVTIRVSCLS